MLNRLISVTKNGTIVAEYGYDPGGVRAVKKVYQNGVNTDKIHYVFEGTEPIFEKRISDSRVRSYIYALGRYLARVDGVIGDSQAKVYHYHADYAGSIKAVTDQAGRIVYNADYLPFGTQISKSGDFDELRGFTGKEYDPDIGLYYFNARWYDPELGRFISEDPAADPNNCNLYSYCGNNPLTKVDPTGKIVWWIPMLIGGMFGGISSDMNGGNFWTGFAMGAVTGAIGIGVNAGLGALGMASGAFETCILSGAISGGAMSALTGGDFWSGVGMGALGGGVAWGLNQLIPGGTDIFQSTDKVKDLLIYGFKTELRALITGGKGISFLDVFEGLTLSAAYHSSTINKSYSSGGAGTDFDPNKIERVVVLNNSGAVLGAGHAAVLLIDSNGVGMYYSYGPNADATAVGPGQMNFQELSAKDVAKFLKTGNIGTVHGLDGGTLTLKTVKEQHYNRFLEYKVGGDTGLDGYKMWATANNIKMNLGTYVGVGHSCENVAVDILKSGGLNIPYNAIPNESFKVAYNLGSWTDAWKVIKGVKYTDPEHILK